MSISIYLHLYIYMFHSMKNAHLLFTSEYLSFLGIQCIFTWQYLPFLIAAHHQDSVQDRDVKYEF